ncbi:MAG: DUF4364 family protein [Clostridia bacterium]|nr:DUF4364 family protein [Clostridia bacterium]
MKLSSDEQTLAENKILILYILDKVGKDISNSALLNLVLAVTDMNYFYFQQFLLDLLQNKYITTYEKEETTFYSITDFGKKTLSLTQDILPGIIKLRVDANFKEELETYEHEHSVIAEFIPRNENYYDITCKVVENSETIFEVKTFVGSKEQAKSIVDNWKNHADKIYPEILKILTK